MAYTRAVQTQPRCRQPYQFLRMVFLLLSTLSLTSAYDMEAVDVSGTIYYRQMLQKGQLVVDTRDPPRLQGYNLAKRQENNATTTGFPNATATTTSTTSGTSSSTALPQPFDTSIGNNFTNSACPAYFSVFLNNATFHSCLPISMLLQNSNSWFKTAKSASELTKTLDTSCDASLALCSPLMAHFASELISNDNCGQDYSQNNPLVVQAYEGFIAYEPLYQATCLKDSASGQYCFAEALLKTNSSADSYPYYTAVGIDLPTNARPTCNQCLQETMQIFAGYAVKKNQPLASTYLPCALQVNVDCGSSFANVQVQAGSQSSSTSAGNALLSKLPDWMIAVGFAVAFCQILS